LGADDFVISADEKTSIQARRRKQPTLPPAPNRPIRVEHESTRRVFWIMDNCSAHRGQKAVERFRAKWPNTILIHTPIHASWLSQVEIDFSIVQRKVLTPTDFSSLAELEQRLLAFQVHFERTASKFKWSFTPSDRHKLLAKIHAKRLATAA
jgi:transposase